MKKQYKILIACLLALAVFGASAQAQQSNNDLQNLPAVSSAETTPDAATIAAAMDLMKITKSDELAKQIFPILAKNMTSIIVKDNPQKEALVNDLIQKYYVPAFSDHLGELQTQLAIVYARNLTLEDIQGVIAFYKTPIGQKYLEATPVIVAQTMPITKIWAQQVAHDALQNLVDQLKKNNLQVPKGTNL